MVNVYTPKRGENIQKIGLTKADREKHLKEFREDKMHQQRLKEERFAEIQDRRRKRSGGSGGGINIKVESDKKK